MFLTITAFVIILGLLVFVHELGHFVTAKKMGVKVEEFGFGFPPRMFGIKRGETIYSLNWIPLGGFVKIKGEQGENAQDQDSFANKKIWQRGIILSSGVIMNVVLCAVLISLGFMIGLPMALDDNLEKATIQETKIQIEFVLEDSPAASHQVQAGDTILSIDGQVFDEVAAVQKYIGAKIGESISIELARAQEVIQIEVIPEWREELEQAGIGVALLKTGLVSYPWYLAIWEGFVVTFILLKVIVLAFYHLIRDLIITQKVLVELSGPVGIAVITGRVVEMGFIYLLQFTALLSLNLAVINFLPFPALDGGRLLFLGLEKIRGRSFGQKVETIIHNIGFLLLLLLVLVVTFRDILKFDIWGKIF